MDAAHRSVKVLEVPEDVSSIMFTSSNRLVVASMGGLLTVWDLDSAFSEQYELEGSIAFAMAPDGNRVSKSGLVRSFSHFGGDHNPSGCLILTIWAQLDCNHGSAVAHGCAWSGNLV
jgi:hypothetical protein